MLRILITHLYLIAAAGFLATPVLAAKTPDFQPSPNTTTGHRIALVIGNGAYQSKEIPKLGNPPNDAEDVASALKKFGFEVLAYKNLTRRAMKDAIAEFGRRAGNAEAALFYYAGHGVQIRNQNFLIPVDASVRSEADIMDEGININLPLDEMEIAKSRVNIVLLDACRDNPVTGKFRSAGGRGLAAPGGSTPKGTIIVYATDPGNTASDGEGRNGTFTAGLLAAFKGRDLSLDGVLTATSEQVEKASKGTQTPYINGPQLVKKNFYFAVSVNPGDQEIERVFWESIKGSQNAADFEAYLKKYPKGDFRSLAENRLRALQRSSATATSTPAATALPLTPQVPAAKSVPSVSTAPASIDMQGGVSEDSKSNMPRQPNIAINQKSTSKSSSAKASAVTFSFGENTDPDLITPDGNFSLVNGRIVGIVKANVDCSLAMIRIHAEDSDGINLSMGVATSKLEEGKKSKLSIDLMAGVRKGELSRVVFDSISCMPSVF
ncbi:MAG: caspase family protein [Betaproteobacteria bacterium]